LERLYRDYGKKVDFRIVYIREAHPTDGRRMRSNDEAGIAVKDPKTDAERKEVAKTCVDKLKITIPALIDGIDNAVEKAYAGWPTRMYVIGKDGKILYQGPHGAGGTRPRQAEEVLKKLE